MIYITPKEKIEEYFQSPALGQSALKELIFKTGTALRKKQEQEKTLYYEDDPEHFIVGSGVDTWLTQGGREAFADKYYISNLESKPSIPMMSIVKSIFDTVVSELDFSSSAALPAILPLSEYEALTIEAVRTAKWNEKWGDKAVVDAVKREGTDYWNELVLAKGKQVISLEEFTVINSVIGSLLENAKTKIYFTMLSEHEENCEYDLFFQVPIYFEYEGVQCKALIDVIKVFKYSGEVILGDLKTMAGRVIDFTDSMRKRRYDIQAQWYTMAYNFAGKRAIKDLFPRHPRNSAVKSTVDFFHFIVESTTHTGHPAVFKVGPALSEIALKGRPMLFTEGVSNKEYYILRTKPILGIQDLMVRYRWYNDYGFDKDYDLSRLHRNEIIEIDWYGNIPRGGFSLIET